MAGDIVSVSVLVQHSMGHMAPSFFFLYWTLPVAPAPGGKKEKHMNYKTDYLWPFFPCMLYAWRRLIG